MLGYIKADIVTVRNAKVSTTGNGVVKELVYLVITGDENWFDVLHWFSCAIALNAKGGENRQRLLL
jgi:hypothetical protein